MKRLSEARVLVLVLLSALVLGAWGCGGGGGGGGGAPAQVKATIKGDITRGAPRVSVSSAQRALARVPDSLTLVVVAVDETGATAASQVLAPPTTTFSLDVPVGHDYVIQFRQDTASGPLLAVLDVAPNRPTFSIAAPAAGAPTLVIDLKTVDVDMFKGVAEVSDATTAAAIAAALAPATSAAGTGIFTVNNTLTDTDGDQLPDGFEIASGPGFDPKVKTDPNLDTDGDGLTVIMEAKLGTSDKNKDSDGDGIADGTEDANHNGVVDATDTNPANKDTDGDGIDDGTEVTAGLNPRSAADAALDADLDGLSNLKEFQLGTNLKKADTDGDALADGAEVTLTTDPLKADTDGDGVADGPDGFPLNATRFAAYKPAELVRLAGAKFSAAAAVNDIDQVVGTSDNTAGVVNAVMWDTHTGIPPFNPTQLGGLAAGKYSAALGINNLSEVVGEAVDATGAFMPVLWNAASATAPPPTALQLAAGDTDGSAYSINSAGQIVGESRNPATGSTRAVVWSSTAAAPTLLPAPGAGTFSSSAAYFINDNGQIAGEATDAAGGKHATLWTVDAAGTVSGVQDLGAPPGHGPSVAYGVNEQGQVVGESIHLDTPDPHSVLWTVAAGAITITHLGTVGTPSNTLAVNSRGRVAGWSGTAAVVWDNFVNPTKSETAADSTLLSTASPTGASQAFGINIKGTVVGMFQASAAGAAAGDQAFVAVTAPQVVP